MVYRKAVSFGENGNRAGYDNNEKKKKLLLATSCRDIIEKQLASEYCVLGGMTVTDDICLIFVHKIVISVILLCSGKFLWPKMVVKYFWVFLFFVCLFVCLFVLVYLFLMSLVFLTVLIVQRLNIWITTADESVSLSNTKITYVLTFITKTEFGYVL